MKLGRNVNTLIVLCSLCMACISRSACSIENSSNYGIHDFSGEYVLTGVEKHRGGLTSQKQAKSKINEKVLICPQKFQDSNNNIEQSKYKFVLSIKHSTHYGFMTDRKSIQYLYLLSANGYFYFFKKIRNCKY